MANNQFAQMGEQAKWNLPKTAKTKSGIGFSPQESIWKFRDDVKTISLNFDRIEADTMLIEGFKYVLLWQIENQSSSSTQRILGDFVQFCKVLSEQNGELVQCIDEIEILNYKTSQNSKTFGRLGSLSGFFKQWYELGAFGVTEKASKLLEQLRIKGNDKGVAVLTADPIEGPLIEIEFEAVISKLNNSFRQQNTSLRDYVLSMLIICFGLRPVQCAALKICDISKMISNDGAETYAIQIPRAKQKNSMLRDEFKTRLLDPALGELIWMHAEDVKNEIGDDAPLFPMKESKSAILKGFERHSTSGGLGKKFKSIIDALDIVSIRTGEQLNIFPYRLRRTLGTRAASEGHGELVIAELLDHTDTQNVGVYVEATPQIIERIDRAIALQLAPLAQAFSGVIITKESEAIRFDDPTSRVCDPRFDSAMKPMGNCGNFGFCGELAPIACYTCQNFQPWLDGPHDKVLDFLISERERLKIKTDARIASINDRTILAVAHVVNQCREMNSKAEGAICG